jgi:hypothetical protein
VIKHAVDQVSAWFTREVDRWEARTRVARQRGVELFSKELEGSQLKPALPVPERVGGTFSLLMALVLVGMAVSHPQLWWLVFVAFGVGKKGLRQLAPGSRPLAAPVAAPIVHEVDALCDSVRTALAQCPEAVSSFLQQPDATIESLRATAKALDVRRLQLAREAPTAQQLADLEEARRALLVRFDTATDGLARTHLNAALESLDGQLNAQRALRATGERVEREYGSLLAALQQIKARLTVAGAAGTPVQVGALHENVARLNDELDAISDALVSVRPGEALRQD